MCECSAPHGHVAPVYDNSSEACGGLSGGPGSGVCGPRAAAPGNQPGAVGAAPVAASVAGLYQLLQDVVGLGVMAEDLQHPQDVTVRISQFEKALHFDVLLPVHPVSSHCLSVCLGNPPRLLILAPQRLRGNGLLTGVSRDGVDLCQCKQEAQLQSLRQIKSALPTTTS